MDLLEDTLQRQFAESSDSDTRRAKKTNGTSEWNDKPESDFNPDDIGSYSDADSLTQGRNLARQKPLKPKRNSIGADHLYPNRSPYVGLAFATVRLNGCCFVTVVILGIMQCT
ncbi:hypothetical protein T265_09660 [Opisthorchis viverrini]|uniref:Uncharacterized protein n=1 Tax=Opisthorchis viverrini TaxID=6198 RepID=A0A074ZG26_OPIVI|nr:hypothetical protein T265_09660 [Opisthorchis viverrini]KER22175.1 hypothetical protein T265_09660 [Opisthorchis viverrini]